MKYLKKFESYSNFTELEDEIEDIKFILQDFKDDSWVVNIDYVPKRWENPKANFTIESDNIKIYLKKKNCKSGSKYPLDAEFSSIEIKDEINQILSIYNDSKIEFNICTADRSYKDENHKHFVEIRNYLYGKWESISTEDFIDFINGNNKLLGIDIKIYLNTENLDQIKKFESFAEYNIDEDSEHLKDLSLDLQDEGEWTITIHTNTEKYNEDEYSCKVILEPLEEFDWDGPGVAEGNYRGSKINKTLVLYMESIIKYMEDYNYRIILTSDKLTDSESMHLENLEAFKKWIEEQLLWRTPESNRLPKGDIIYGFKGDYIIIEFYEKDDEINESNIPYKYDWCRPESPIRKEIEEYIKELVSLGDLK
jgi:hypothetical protein